MKLKPGRPPKFNKTQLLEERKTVIRGIRDGKDMSAIALELGYKSRQSLGRHKGVRSEALSKIRV